MESYILIIGAGGMARAIAYDLRRRQPAYPLVVLDRDREALSRMTAFVGEGEVQTICGDAGDLELLKRLLSRAAVGIGAASYRYNYNAAALAIGERAHWIDLGGNPTVVARQMELNNKAKATGVAVMPDCGLAPGMVNVIGGDIVRRIPEIEELHFRVGGLPQFPKPPLFYGLVFSPEGLANEYSEPARVIEDGVLKEVESLTGWERVYVGPPLGTLEAFHTAGGSSTMVETFRGRVKALDYKTLRYPGHLRRIKLLGDLGFWGDDELKLPPPAPPYCVEGDKGGVAVTPRAVLGTLLMRQGWVTEDLVALAAWGIGKRNGMAIRVDYRMTDYYDPATGLTAMARTTGFPAAIVARMLVEGGVTETGVLKEEMAIPSERFLAELGERGIRFEVTERGM